jgi:hypothetical protein
MNSSPMVESGREDLNSQPLVCVCLWLLSVCFNCALVACACVLFLSEHAGVATWREALGYEGERCFTVVGFSQNVVIILDVICFMLLFGVMSAERRTRLDPSKRKLHKYPVTGEASYFPS